jgi:tetratricopeptide (TPR) repeat protein
VQRFAEYHPRAWKVRKGFPRMTPFRVLAMAFAAALWTPLVLSQSQVARPEPAAKPNVAEAQTLLKQGKTDEALKLLGGLATGEPEAAGLETALGTAYFQSHKFPQAIEHLSKALKQNPDDLQATQVLALSFYGSGDFAKAAPLLEKLGPRLPLSNPDGPYLLGICYIMTGRSDDARRALAQLFRVPPESAMAYLMLGKMLVRQKMEDRAVPQIEKAIQVDPRLAMAHFLLGEIDLYKEDPQHAVEEFQKELAINPTVWLVYWRLGDAYFRLERLDEAESVLKQSIWLNESSSGSFILLGRIALKRNDASLASGFLEHALKLDPQNYYVHYFLGRAYQSLGRTAEATQHFEASKSLRSDRQAEERSMFQGVP